MFQVAGRVMRTTMKMITTANSLGHRTASVAATWQQTAGAPIRAVAFLIRANHRFVICLFRFFRDRQVNLGRHLLSDADSAFHGTSSMGRVADGVGGTAMLVISAANRVGNRTTSPSS